MSKKPLSPGYRFQAQILEFCIYSLITVSVLVLFAFIIILVNHFKTPADASTLTNKLLPFGFFFSVIALFLPIILTTKRKAMIAYSICSIQIVNTDDSEISSIKWFFRSLVKLISPVFILGSGVVFFLPLIFYPMIATAGKRDGLDFLFGTKAIIKQF